MGVAMAYSTTNDLSRAALNDLARRGSHFGVVQHELSDGSVLFCTITKVAGRSIVGTHLRTEFDLCRPGERWSTRISSAAASTLLAEPRP